MKFDLKYDVIIFLYKLQDNNVYIWLGENDKLQIHSEKQLSPEIFDKLKQLKFNIIDILKENNIYTKPPHPCIYKYKNVNNTYPLSFSQERLLFIDKFSQGTNAYNMPYLFSFKSEIDVNIMRQCFIDIVDKHAILKSIYNYHDGDYYQQSLTEKFFIQRKRVFSNEELDLQLKQFFSSIFDLENEIPLKIKFYFLNTDVYVSMLFHHIAFDGWSIQVFLNDLKTLYFQIKQKSPMQAQTNNIEYSDFVIWQRCHLTENYLSKQKSYWTSILDNFETLNFPIDKQRPAEFNYKGNSHSFCIDKKLTESLKIIAKQQSTTLYTILLSAYYILLHKYTHQNDIIIGSPSAGRNFKQLENVIGILHNILPLRLKIKDITSIESLLKIVGDLVLSAQENQDIPFEKIVELLDIEKDISRNPIFQVAFATKVLIFKSPFIKQLNTNRYLNTAKHDLTLTVEDSKNPILDAEINYSTSLFAPKTIKRIAKQYVNILKQITLNLSVPFKNIQILTEEETNTILYKWNDTKTPYPENKTIHAMFEKQAEISPEKTAIKYNNSALTYKELNNLAGKIAYRIKSYYKEKYNKDNIEDKLIVIYSERSPYAIAGIIGILKSGAAFVPIDAYEPTDRLELKIKDSGCDLILTTHSLLNNFTSDIIADSHILQIEEILNNSNNTNVLDTKTTYTSNSLAYMIYTSGSTGIPKGVQIEHRSLVNFIYTTIKKHEQFQLPTPKIFSLTNFDFDIFGLELWGALLSSGTLILIDHYKKTSPKLLTEYINTSKPDVIQGTPALLSTIIFNSLEDCKKTLFIVGGEAVNNKLSNKLCSVSDNAWNYYGPTETTIWSTSYNLNNSTDILIGKPLPNQKCFILDQNLQPTPIGVTGDLYIGGIGLSRGYLNNTKLTNSAFINNPYSNNNEKIYKTGDKACWHIDGNIDFLGRQDRQIKLRGYRVEPGEIQNIINKFPKINQCYISIYNRDDSSENKSFIDMEFSTQLLIAYYTLKKDRNAISVDKDSFSDNLREFLYTKLPEYMIPNIFIYLDNFPLNSSGKIDISSLPGPKVKPNTKYYIPPETNLESEICKIWEDILNVDKIGIKDNFFKLGGTSMLAIRLAHKISSSYDKHIPVAEIFLNPTIQQLADFIENEKQAEQDNENWEF